MSPPDDVDEGWGDGPDDGGADEGAERGGDADSEAGGDDAGPAGAATEAAGGEAPRRKRRRRRRRRDGDAPREPQAQTQTQSQTTAQRQAQTEPHPQPQPTAERHAQTERQPTPERQGQAQQGASRQARQDRGAREARHDRGPREARPERTDREPRPERTDRGPRGARSDRGERGGQRERRNRDPRESRGSSDAGAEHDLRGDDDILRGDPYALRDATATQGAAEPARGSQPAIDDDDHASEAPAIAWGSEDEAAAPAVTLAPDLPVDAPASDPDPLTYPLVDGPGAQLGDDVASVVGIRFVPAGRIQWLDAGETDYLPGERVLVDSDRGQRLAWIATAPARRPVRDRNLRRVIRRAHDGDLRGERDGEADRVRALRVAKDVAASLRLPLKVFRVEKTGGKLNVYYTSDERLDLRDFVREIGQATGLRLELRQLGVRDEAKVVGGIGSCGLTLCCTTWLPDFVPVSIKMAKDQGLVLSPTKVSGQCGRLKCCLVYEQAGYAELRKGLPKLGKRVISPRGEGRVVEVDVLRQRVRVSYGAGDTEVLPATEVKPMFPSANQPREPEPAEPNDGDDHLPPS